MTMRPYLVFAYRHTPTRSARLSAWHTSAREALTTQAELEALGWAVSVSEYQPPPTPLRGKLGLLSGRMGPRQP